MDPEIKPIHGRLVVFLFGETGMNLETSKVVEIKTIKSAPSYPDVIPKQKIIKVEKHEVEDVEVGFVSLGTGCASERTRTGIGSFGAGNGRVLGAVTTGRDDAGAATTAIIGSVQTLLSQTQGALTGTHPNLQRRIGWAMYALRKYFLNNADKCTWNNLVVITLSEFGRTTVQNASAGTDHAEVGEQRNTDLEPHVLRCPIATRRADRQGGVLHLGANQVHEVVVDLELDRLRAADLDLEDA